MLARTPASPPKGLHYTMDLGVSIFFFFCTMCGLEKLGLTFQNGLERDMSALLLITLVVGRRQ